MAQPVSHSQFLRILAVSFGIIPIGYGINALFHPLSAMNIFFLFPSTTDPLVEPTMYIYGIRAIYMGLTVLVAAYFGHRKTLGGILIALSTISAVDGAVAREYGLPVEGQGRPETGHWVWGPPCAIVGALLMGIWD